ncbi:MAG TPA: LON peptidase substrate-binding domain-containing protein [Gaiellaceae bacterium]
MSEIGLFPLPIVLLPTEEVPLHIFEDRYQELIGECVEDDREFGLVYADDDGIREVGTRARVTKILARFEDGRMNILVEGRERFRLLELISARSFQTGEVAALSDEDDPAEARSIERAVQLFGRLRELTGSDVEIPPSDSQQLSYALAARVELAPDVKQELLQEVSERARLERVCELLVGAAATVERQRRAAERAASNGKVDLG